MPTVARWRNRCARRHTCLVPNCIHGIDDRFCAVCTNKGRPKPGKRETVQAKAAAHNPATDVEREAFEAVYAYQEARSTQAGRPFRASRTWPMIERLGILAAVERLVSKADDSDCYPTLVGMGMEDMAFESVVVRHRDAFSEKAVTASEARLKKLKG